MTMTLIQSDLHARAASIVGRAVAGHVNNGGLTVHGTLPEVCTAVVTAIECGSDECLDLSRVVEAAGNSLDEMGVDYSGLPHPASD